MIRFALFGTKRAYLFTAAEQRAGLVHQASDAIWAAQPQRITYRSAFDFLSDVNWTVEKLFQGIAVVAIH